MDSGDGDDTGRSPKPPWRRNGLENIFNRISNRSGRNSRDDL